MGFNSYYKKAKRDNDRETKKLNISIEYTFIMKMTKKD